MKNDDKLYTNKKSLNLSTNKLENILIKTGILRTDDELYINKKENSFTVKINEYELVD